VCAIILSEVINMISRKRLIYKESEYFMIKNNFNGTIDIAQGEEVNRYGEACWLGVERCVEKDEVKFL
jgi:hypothetical protein